MTATLEAAPAADFPSLGLPRWLVRSLAARGITEPFPIQAATVPDALAGRDVSGRAPTGAGKTLAFGVPLALRVGRAAARRPRGLVLAPTRELAAQITKELRLLGVRGLRVEAFYGGVGFDRQLRALREGVDVAVACPGRLVDLISQGHVDLDQVEVVVIDEADRMADMGFLPEVRRLLDRCPADRQTLLFSATLDGDVDVLVSRYQRDPVRHDLGGSDEHPSTAEHLFWSVARTERVGITASLVSASGPTVVFCRTKRGADRVAQQLDRAGVSAVAIHGGRSQSQRDRALAGFRDGRFEAIVATDVAARGIHVDGVACVVHFDPPADPKDYVHRSGRTGRAGASGLVVTLVPEDLHRDVAALQRQVDQRSPIVPPDPALVGKPRPQPRPRVPVTPAPAPTEGAKPARRPRRPAPGGGARPASASRRRPRARQR